MAIDSDVLVIGGGLAGLTSALSAARSGADVRLVSYKQSTLRNASGLVDILGYTPDGEGPLTDPYEVIPDLPAEHPYQTLGLDTVREAMELFDDVAPQYRGSHTDTNALLPTHGGTVKPTARYPDAASAGVVTDSRDMLLVGFEAMTDFNAEHAAAHLESVGLPFEVRGVTIQFPGNLRTDAKVTRYAKLLGADSELSVGGEKKPVRTALADRVNAKMDGEGRVGFPAVLGDHQTAAVREELGERLDCDVFEVPMGPPSLPGLRLEDTLFAALDEAGGNYQTGNPVEEFEAADRRIENVIVERNGSTVPYSADEYILATGGLVGKGINSNRESIYEPIFDCHIDHSEDRYDWFDTEAFGDHPFASYGVTTDSQFRPVDDSGAVEFENLRAAGSVLGGYDFAAEKSGSGVSIATGYDAGNKAAMEAL